MNFFRTQIDRLQQPLGGMNQNQKLLLAGIIGVMLLTLILWSSTGSSPEMQPVLDQSLALDDISKIKSFLIGKGYPVKVSNDRVLVPAERHMEALSDLTYTQLLPRDTRSGFDVIFKQMSPWDSPAVTDGMWNESKQITLAKIICGWPDVTNASVVIDQKEAHGFEKEKKAATIDIKTRLAGKLDRKLVNAAADLVVGSVAGIDRSNIKVIVDGMSQSNGDQTMGSIASGDNLMELRQANEKYYAEKIEKQLAWMNAQVFVSVSVDVNTRTSQQEKTTVDPKNFVHKEIKATRSLETQNVARNMEQLAESTGPMDGTANVDDPGSIKADRRSEFALETSKTVEHSLENAGKPTVKMATVRVPRSYFVRVCREINGEAKSKDPVAVKSVIDEELLKIRADVKACTGLVDDQMVMVESYVEATPALATIAPVAQVSSVHQLLGNHSKEVGIAVVGGAMLVVVVMATRRPAPHIASDHQEPMDLHSAEMLAGIGSVFDSVDREDELDPAHEMAGQVSGLVKERPEAAADLVKQWLNR